MNQESNSERPFWISKDTLDTVNSGTWFFMDAFWMLGSPEVSLFFVAPTIATGLMLLYVEKRRNVFWINSAINCWIWMNTFWLFSEVNHTPHLINYAKAAFILGLVFIFAAIKDSISLKETFSHFRRFRKIKSDHEI